MLAPPRTRTMSSDSDGLPVAGKKRQAGRVRRVRRKVAAESDSDDAPTPAQQQPLSRLKRRGAVADSSDEEPAVVALPASAPPKAPANVTCSLPPKVLENLRRKFWPPGIWQIVLDGQGLWGEAHVKTYGSYLQQTGTRTMKPLEIDGHGTAESPFRIGDAKLIESGPGFRVWQWPGGTCSRWTEISPSASSFIPKRRKQDEVAATAGSDARDSVPESPGPVSSDEDRRAPTKKIYGAAEMAAASSQIFGDSDAESSLHDTQGLSGSEGAESAAEAPIGASDAELSDDAGTPPRRKARSSRPAAKAATNQRPRRAAAVRALASMQAAAAAGDWGAEATGDLADSDAESFDEHEQRGATKGPALPDVLQDPQADTWRQDLEARRGTPMDPRSSFSSSSCSQTVIRRLPESSFLNGRPIFDSAGRVNLHLVAAAYSELASRAEACLSDTDARHILWLAEAARGMQLLSAEQLRRGKLVVKKKQAPQQRSSDTVFLAADRELRFPARPLVGNKRKAGSADGGEFFSDEEDPMEEFVRRKRAVMQLRVKNTVRQAAILSQSSHGLDMDEVRTSLTAPKLSFDWNASRKKDADDEDEESNGCELEVGVPEDEQHRDSRRDLFKDSIQRSISRRWADKLKGEVVPEAAEPEAVEEGVVVRTSRRKRVLHDDSEGEETSLPSSFPGQDAPCPPEEGTDSQAQPQPRVEMKSTEEGTESQARPQPTVEMQSMEAQPQPTVETQPTEVTPPMETASAASEPPVAEESASMDCTMEETPLTETRADVQEPEFPKADVAVEMPATGQTTSPSEADLLSARKETPEGQSSPIKTRLPAWVRKLQAAGLAIDKLSESEPSSPSVTIEEREGSYRACCRTASQAAKGLLFAVPNAGPWRKTLSKAKDDMEVLMQAARAEAAPEANQVDAKKQERKQKQALLLDMFRRSLSKTLSSSDPSLKSLPAGNTKELPTASQGGKQVELVATGTGEAISGDEKEASIEATEASIEAKDRLEVEAENDLDEAITDTKEATTDAKEATVKEAAPTGTDVDVECGPTESSTKSCSIEVEECFGAYRAICTFADGRPPGQGPWRTNEEEAKEDGEVMVAANGEAAAPSAGVPQAWAEALEGAFPALRRLRRLSAGKPVEEGEEGETDDELEDDDEDGEGEVEEDEEEVALSAEFVRSHRQMLRRKRRQARKRDRKLKWELMDIAEIRDEVEKMVSLGTATMNEEEQFRWQQLIDATFASADSTAAPAAAPPASSAAASSNATVAQAPPPAKKQRILFSGRNEDDASNIYMCPLTCLAGTKTAKPSFLRSASKPLPSSEPQDEELTVAQRQRSVGQAFLHFSN